MGPLETFESIYLITGAFIGSLISGISGIGGGTLLIAIMATVMAPPQLIPAHGIVQLSSNFSRVVLHFKKIDRKIIFQYLAGAVIGGLLGTQLDFDLPPEVTKTGLGLFILVLTWLPLKRILGSIVFKNYSLVGAVSTVLSLFVGIAGPLLHPFLLREERLDKFSFVATESVCAAISHSLKIAVFFFWGISLKGYWLILFGMMAVSFLGAYLGKKVIKKIPEEKFRLFVRILISILAARLVFNL